MDKPTDKDIEVIDLSDDEDSAYQTNTSSPTTDHRRSIEEVKGDQWVKEEKEVKVPIEQLMSDFKTDPECSSTVDEDRSQLKSKIEEILERMLAPHMAKNNEIIAKLSNDCNKLQKNIKTLNAQRKDMQISLTLLKDFSKLNKIRKAVSCAAVQTNIIIDEPTKEDKNEHNEEDNQQDQFIPSTSADTQFSAKTQSARISNTEQCPSHTDPSTLAKRKYSDADDVFEVSD